MSPGSCVNYTDARRGVCSCGAACLFWDVLPRIPACHLDPALTALMLEEVSTLAVQHVWSGTFYLEYRHVTWILR